MPWAVLLVDDNSLMRRSVRSLFGAHPDFTVVGEAEHGGEAIDKARLLRPHLVILDFAMPVMNGLEAAPIIFEHLPGVRIIMLTLFSGDRMEASARAAGIHAVVSKNNAATQLISTAYLLLDPNGVVANRKGAAV
jgi:DNA-binding NarL/FixJ family response regulator